MSHHGRGDKCVFSYCATLCPQSIEPIVADEKGFFVFAFLAIFITGRAIEMLWMIECKQTFELDFWEGLFQETILVGRHLLSFCDTLFLWKCVYMGIVAGAPAAVLKCN